MSQILRLMHIHPKFEKFDILWEDLPDTFARDNFYRNGMISKLAELTFVCLSAVKVRNQFTLARLTSTKEIYQRIYFTQLFH